MKRILSVLLAIGLLLSCISLAAAEDKKSLTVWIPQYQFSKAEDAISDQDFWDGIFDKFEAENNCEVKVEILSWSDYNTTIYTGLLNEDGPDVVYVTDNYDLVKADLLLGLEGYLTQEEMDNYLLWSTGPVNAEGKHVIVPMDDGVAMGFVNQDILAEAGAKLLQETVERIERGDCPRQKQNEAEMSYYPMLTKETGHIDFQKPAESIVHLICGVSPWPGAYFKSGEESVKIWSAEAVRSGSNAKAPGEVIAADAEQGLLIQAGGNSALKVLELQLPGGKRLKTADYLRGHRFPYTKVE